MSYKSSYFRCLEHRLSILHEDMDDQEAVNVVNHEIPPEKLKSLVQQGHTTSFIFSIKNRVGGLARALKVFQRVLVYERLESSYDHFTEFSTQF
ncbi:unnamed protein product [Rotaria sp. Silwood2]|nr:unnamed protein product [Rotaria sp. Silwood2]